MAKKEKERVKSIELRPQGAWPIFTKVGFRCGTEKRGGFSFAPSSGWPHQYTTAFSCVLTREDTRRLRDHLNDVIALWDEEEAK